MDLYRSVTLREYILYRVKLTMRILLCLVDWVREMKIISNWRSLKWGRKNKQDENQWSPVARQVENSWVNVGTFGSGDVQTFQVIRVCVTF